MPIISIEKGKRGERELASILRSKGWTDARRGIQYTGTSDSPDVVGIPGIHFERKRVGALRIYDAMAQAREDAGSNIPVVSFRGNGRGKTELAILTLDDFLNLLKQIPQYSPRRVE